MNTIAANLEQLYQRIEAATRRVGRNPQEITLVAVTKTHPLETVISGYQAGLRHFGENRAEEGNPKVTAFARWLETVSAPEKPTWHFIGHLQSRKAGLVLGQFSLIHSVDSLKLAQRIDRLARRDGYPPVEILLQCNVSGEATKSGFALERWQTDQQQLVAFLKTVEQIAQLDHLLIRGLMTMAPLCEHPEETRPVFRSLAALKQVLQKEMPQIDWQHLSMGMTDDFEVAIEEGATIIRVGRAIFGERELCPVR